MGVRSVRVVKQGCTLSPLLFGLCTEELGVLLRKSGFGLKVGEEKLSCLLYADDIFVSRALGAPKWTAAEALRGDLRWSLFSERMVKAVLNYKVRIQRMENKRWVERIFEWNLSEIIKRKFAGGMQEKLRFRRLFVLELEELWMIGY
ncbi:Reverse transcriptase domain [Trinorchestia longiramus]|nr:Reverse transcriptase domain [Trinorchestia longiramus]